MAAWPESIKDVAWVTVWWTAAAGILDTTPTWSAAVGGQEKPIILFHVRMDVAVPRDLDPRSALPCWRRRTARALELHRTGVWRDLWRVVGQYSNVSPLHHAPPR